MWGNLKVSSPLFPRVLQGDWAPLAQSGAMLANILLICFLLSPVSLLCSLNNASSGQLSDKLISLSQSLRGGSQPKSKDTLSLFHFLYQQL